jgi:hypothetical protein
MAAIESLQTFPQRCAYSTENDRFPFEVRQLLFGRKPNVYRVVFRIEGEGVHMFAFGVLVRRLAFSKSAVTCQSSSPSKTYC